MDYREIVSVTGIGGLFQLMATKSDGAIVRNLSDKSTRFIPARLHNVTPLESIEVYTVNENVRLHTVFEKMKEHEGVEKPDAKKAGNEEIKNYFKSIFPEFDEERVYVSDMKKMLKWFDVLKENDLLDFDFYKEEIKEEAPAEPEIAVDEEKPVKKAKAKKAETETSADGEEKPKKVAKKKKSVEENMTDAEEKPAKKTARKKKEE